MNKTAHRTVFDSPNWFRASTLRQRAASLHGTQVETSHSGHEGDDTLAALYAWASESGLTTDDLIDDRLYAEDMDRRILMQVMSEPLERVRARLSSSASWLRTLHRAFLCEDSDRRVELPVALHDQPLAGFLQVIAPLVGLSRKTLRRKIEHWAHDSGTVPFAANSIEPLLYEPLPGQLLMRLARVLTLELHVSRFREELSSKTSAERFESFVERLGTPQHALQLLEEYPVLAQQLVLCVDQWKNSSFEFVQRLADDWQSIDRTFANTRDSDGLGQLDRLVAGLGDRHHGGRAAMMVQFESGVRVVYKPRSHAVDVHFQDLVRWLNDRGMGPPLSTLRVVDREEYGWSEFVPARQCNSAEESDRFHQRQGAYLALFYALGATDMHFENIIASGEDPYMIDIESILQPKLGDGQVQDDPNAVVWKPIHDSVMQTGMLPETFGLESNSATDLSGLSGGADQVRLNATPHWNANGTDEVRYTRRQQATVGGQNHPYSNAAKRDAS